jgi:hypothetical protein
MIYDYRSKGRVHRIYLIGAVVMAIALLRLPFGTSPAWQSIGVPLFESLTR